jgi:hypothetical protein
MDIQAAVDRDGYAVTLEQKRRAFLLAAGAVVGLELVPNLSIGSGSIGYYDRATKTWSNPETC